MFFEPLKRVYTDFWTIRSGFWSNFLSKNVDRAIKASTEGWENEGGPGGGAGATAELQALDPWKVTGGTRGPCPRTPGAVCVCVLPRGTQWPALMPPNT